MLCTPENVPSYLHTSPPCLDATPLSKEYYLLKTSWNAQVNVLNYLETICCDVYTANIIVNAPLTPLLVRLLAAAGQPALRVRLASVLGMLVRHCTFIDDDVDATGAITCPSQLALNAPGMDNITQQWRGEMNKGNLFCQSGQHPCSSCASAPSSMTMHTPEDCFLTSSYVGRVWQGDAT